jgi:hypothetical protein
MKYKVNFYIHIYNHPMYIIKNFDEPYRNIHLSYHDGEHYNSIRLKDDFSDELPQEISLDLINCVEQTTNAEVMNENKEEEENEEEKEEVERKADDETVEKENHPLTSDDKEIVVNGVMVKDNKEKSQKYQKCIITPEGIILNEISDFKKCHCDSNKKYKACCSDTDVKGEFNKSENIFYCNLEIFKSKINPVTKENTKNEKTDDTINTITKKLDKIFI